jgi:hypothetical protein
MTKYLPKVFLHRIIVSRQSWVIIFSDFRFRAAGWVETCQETQHWQGLLVLLMTTKDGESAVNDMERLPAQLAVSVIFITSENNQCNKTIRNRLQIRVMYAEATMYLSLLTIAVVANRSGQ